MPVTTRAKIYIAWVAAVGLTILAMGLFQWTSANPARYLLLLVLALVAATLKVRLPGITSSMSVNFLFILLGVADLSFSETLAMGCAAALLQSVWKAAKRPRPVQLLFNVACLAISIGVAYGGSHFALSATRTNSLILSLALAASLFLVTNTGLVAVVLSLAEHQPLRQAWRLCYGWAFPYYLVGTAIAGLISASSHAVGWKVSLLLLPTMYLTYIYYRLYLERQVEEQRQLTLDDDKVVAAVSARRS